MHLFFFLTEEITASFRRFGPLVVDWPHKAESKSYFPPKGMRVTKKLMKRNNFIVKFVAERLCKDVWSNTYLEILHLFKETKYYTTEIFSTQIFDHILKQYMLFRLRFSPVSRWIICSGFDWCLYSRGWKIISVCF